MAINSASTRLYATSGSTESKVYAYSINSSTGVLTQIDSDSSDSFPCDVALNDDNTYVYVANQNGNSITTYSINSSTGALTAVGSYATGSYPVRLIVH
jgi:6-phosphogluconolactonase (cycloisomerase 2 family)